MQEEREEERGEEQQEPFTGAVEVEEVVKQPPKKATKPRARKPKVKKIPTLERGSETRLQYVAVDSLFEIGGVLYRLLGNTGQGIQVIRVTPIPGGFSTGREQTMGENTICLPVEIA